MSGNGGLAGLAREGIAAEVLALLDTGGQIEPISGRGMPFGLGEAYAIAAEIRRLREARGERRVGRKIGFTNKNLWEAYGVRAPIWGDMYDTTVRALDDASARRDIPSFAEPLIEPEIVFGFARAPSADMDEEALIGCVDWVAHGFEVVHSIFPGWRFQAADTVVGFGMHGALLVGPRHRIQAKAKGDWLAMLKRFDVELACDGEVKGTGKAEDVLGSPLTALLHLVRGLAEMPRETPLAAGDMVTTGSLTLAFPIAPGESWRSTLSGVPIEPIEVRFG